MSSSFSTSSATSAEPLTPTTEGSDNAQQDDLKHRTEEPISTYTTVAMVFVTHGLVNAALLSGWNNDLRCVYWNVQDCSPNHIWALNWLSFGMLHVYLLIAALTFGAHGNPVAEFRLIQLVCAIVLSNLSSGVHTLMLVHQPMAFIQVMVYLGLLVVTILHTVFFPSKTLQPQSDATTMKGRPKLQFTAVVIAALCILSAFQVLQMTFGTKGREAYFAGTSNLGIPTKHEQDIFDTISDAAVANTLWTTAILTWSVCLATGAQQKSLLAAHAVALFVAQIMFSMAPPNLKSTKAGAASLGNVLSLCICLLGVFDDEKVSS